MPKKKRKPIIKTPTQINNIRTAGQYLTQLLHELRGQTKPGVTLLELEDYAEQYIRKHKLSGAFKGYNGFPANLCLSVNDCLVHGIPDTYVLQPKDLLKIDCGITYKKCIADAAIAIVPGGEFANPAASTLIATTKAALDQALPHIQVGQPIYHFSQAVYDYMTSRGYNIIKVLTGHGVGIDVHEPPYIYNRPHHDTRKTLRQQDMVVALEPITALTSDDYVERPGNHRNLYTQHGDLGAQREYTVHITTNGVEILAGIQ